MSGSDCVHPYLNLICNDFDLLKVFVLRHIDLNYIRHSNESRGEKKKDECEED